MLRSPRSRKPFDSRAWPRVSAASGWRTSGASRAPYSGAPQGVWEHESRISKEPRHFDGVHDAVADAIGGIEGHGRADYSTQRSGLPLSASGAHPRVLARRHAGGGPCVGGFEGAGVGVARGATGPVSTSPGGADRGLSLHLQGGLATT